MEESLAASNSNSVGSTTQSKVLKRKSTDVGWEYGELCNVNNYDKVKCKLCGKMFSGGIYRLKQHVAGIPGNVTSCPKATPLDKSRCKEALVGKKKKQCKKEQFEETKQVIVTDIACKVPHLLGPMDQFARPIDMTSLDENRKLREQNIDDPVLRNKINEVHAYLARWVYECGISFDAINNDAFNRFVEAIGQFGPGYVPPSHNELRGLLLEEEVERTRELLRNQKQEWERYGCSVLIDARSNGKRSVTKLCVNCKGETFFLSFLEDSKEANTGESVFQYVDKHIEEAGCENVIQVVTDDATNNIVAAKMLKEKRPNIFWTSCATYTLNLILEEIGELPKFKYVMDKAKALTTFIYNHHKTLYLMRKFTKKRDILKPGITKFASSFLTMESLLEIQEKLRFMFVSSEWEQCKLSKSTKAAKLFATAISQAFWTNLAICVELFKPLVRVLRLVDEDVKPSMGFVYAELQDAKKEIMKISKDVEATYKPIIEIIDLKVKDRLDSPLHLSGYMLNPYYYYRNDEVENNPKCMEALLTCLEAFFPNDLDEQRIICKELLKYKRLEGPFSHKVAVHARSKNEATFNPIGWWATFGIETPHLRTIAMKILSLTSSSSGYEKDWSGFDEINRKKNRNGLDAERLNNLVFVHFNAKLVNKTKKTNDKCDMLLANDASMAQEWIAGSDDDEEEIDNGSRLSGEDIVDSEKDYFEPWRVRELDDDDYESEDEDEIVFEDSD